MQCPFFVPMQYAILIDAGFLKHKLGSALSPMGLNNVRGLIATLRNHPELKDHHLHRIYYYDAAPYLGKQAKPLTSQTIDFSESSTLSFEGWQLKPRLLKDSTHPISITDTDIIPKISQKGVDMRIGMDMAALTFGVGREIRTW